jgi:SAM-dependent methyltransferase
VAFLARFFPEAKFGGFSDADVTVAFYNRVNALIDESSIVLDFGCGRGLCLEDPVPYRRRLRLLRGKSQKVIGVDIDPSGAVNAAIDEFLRITPGSPWPINDQSIDLILCDCVMEHLPDPAAFFSEARRVLRPGCGILCIRTPNVWSYIGVISRLIPNHYHASALRKAQENRPAGDIFPTLYRCNTITRMRKTMAAHGFDPVVYGAESDPGYLDFASFVYRLGVLHRKLAPGFLRPVIFAFGRLRAD